jgi:hypothetical protein
LNVQFSSPLNEKGTLEIISITGQSLMKQNLNSFSSDLVSVNVSEIPAGIYFLSIKTANFSSQKRFLVVR